MEDSFRVREKLDAGGVERAVIVGAGYIGLETADAFVHRGLRVTLVSRPTTVMPSVDPRLGEIVRSELERHGVEVVTDIEIGEITERDGALEVRGVSGLHRRADLVLVGGGVEPNTDLARAAGVATGERGAIRVDSRMRTNVPDVLRRATVSRPGTACFRSRPICLLERPRTSRAASQERRRSEVTANSRVPSEPWS
jgi:NADPH-dependent 2,4-dienoyl-CoA reductase/sulfur reductase-like enzyme